MLIKIEGEMIENEKAVMDEEVRIIVWSYVDGGDSCTITRII